MANFINGELWGRPTSTPWGVVFPSEKGVTAAEAPALIETGALMPRHPSQLYEALGEGLVLFLVLWFLRRRSWSRDCPGRLTALFMMGYGLVRFLVEFVREPDEGYAL